VGSPVDTAEEGRWFDTVGGPVDTAGGERWFDTVGGPVDTAEEGRWSDTAGEGRWSDTVGCRRGQVGVGGASRSRLGRVSSNRAKGWLRERQRKGEVSSM